MGNIKYVPVQSACSISHISVLINVNLEVSMLLNRDLFHGYVMLGSFHPFYFLLEKSRSFPPAVRIFSSRYNK